MTERNLDSEAAMIVNDLDSLAIRIEMLQAHPRYTEAAEWVRCAKRSVETGRSSIHQRGMRERFGKPERPKTVVHKPTL